VDSNAFSPKTDQPDQSNIDGLDSNWNELLSVIWEAAESFTSPDLMTRISGLERLLSYDAVRQLSLVAYLLATRLDEPDIELRTRIVKTLANLADMNTGSGNLSEDVQRTLISCLSAMRTREVFALLQVVEYDKSTEKYVADLLSWCSFAGSHLAQILSNRDSSTEIRRQAASFIGLIGYLDALPVLQKLASRLESRGEEDTSMLPILQNAVLLLSSP
jgi:hypothetical protein